MSTALRMKRTIINPVIKDKATFLQTSSESGGKSSEIEITLYNGGSNVLHYHKTYSGTLTAIEGRLGLRLGKNEIKYLEPGESHTVAPMSLHSFFNPLKTEIRFHVSIKPGHQGFENALRILYGMAEDGLTNHKSIPRSLRHVAILIEMSDMSRPGLFTWISPILSIIARWAKRKGEDKVLIDRYCK